MPAIPKSPTLKIPEFDRTTKPVFSMKRMLSPSARRTPYLIRIPCQPSPWQRFEPVLSIDGHPRGCQFGIQFQLERMNDRFVKIYRVAVWLPFRINKEERALSQFDTQALGLANLF